MAWSIAAAIARGGARVQATSKEQVSAWGIWCKFITQIEYQDEQFLGNLKNIQQAYLLSCFVQSVCQETYKSGSNPTLVADYERSDPRLDKDGKTVQILQQQYTGYQKKDPPEKQQKAAPASLVKEVTKNIKTNRLKTLAQLVVIG